FRDVTVAAAQRETLAQAFVEGEDTRVVAARIPRTESVRLNQASAAVVDARLKRQVCFAQTEKILDVFVVIVRGHDPIGTQLTLNADGIAPAVGRGEARVDGDRKVARLRNVM